MRKVNEEKWKNLLAAYGIHERFVAEVKMRYDGQYGKATAELDKIKTVAEENGIDINLVLAQVLIRDVFVDLAQAAERWGKTLRVIMKTLPCQQAQYALMDVEAIRMHCDDFIKYGPKDADQEVPLEASEFEPQEQMTLEEYEAKQAQEKADTEEMLMKSDPEAHDEPEAN